MSLSLPAAVPTPAEVAALNAQAYALRHSDARAALALAWQAHGLALQIDDQGGLLQALLRISVCQIILGDAERPGPPPQLAQALGLARSLGHAAGEAEALNLQGLVHRAEQQHEQALQCYQQAQQLYRQVGDAQRENAVLMNLSLLHRDQGHLPEALAAVLQALSLARQAGHLVQQGYALNTLGTLYNALGEPAQAQAHLQQALPLARSSQDRALESTLLINLGRLLTEAGQHEQALAHLRVAFDLAQGTGNAEDMAHALLALGQLHQASQAHAVAAPLLADALGMARRRSDVALTTQVLLAQAATPMAQGQPAQALPLLQAALQAQAQHSGALLASTHQRLSQAFEALGDLPAALDHFKAFHTAHQALQDRAAMARVRALLTEQAVQQVRQAEQARSAELSHALDEARRSAASREQLLAELQAQAEMLQQLAREDGLTGVANRRWLDLQLQRELERARRFGHPLTVVMVDIDHFKAVNDTLGHALGDAVLRQLAQLLRQGLRASDVVGRYGGEEFVLLLVETSAAQARGLADKLRQRIASHAWATLHPQLAPITASLGLAERLGDDESAASLLQRADAQLYRAKHGGRNQVCG